MQQTANQTNQTHQTQKIRVGVVGATGYGGIELVRLLATHPQVEIVALVSRSDAGVRVVDEFSHLRGVLPADLCYIAPQDAPWQQLDVCFFATPHAVAMNQAAFLLDSGVKVIDLSADFRIDDLHVWERWYGTRHTAEALQKTAVYGLPEYNREAIKQAQLVACPGCYPTAAQLALWPLLQHGQWLDHQVPVIIDAKSGSSGAGRTAKKQMLYVERDENFTAYQATGHRHYPEIKQQLEKMAGQSLALVFTPHLLPVKRGIFETIYVKLTDKNADIAAYYQDFYRDEAFVEVLPAGQVPVLSAVVGTNRVQIGMAKPVDSDFLTLFVTEDNLLKGAAGQALQCMNLMFALEETTGLLQTAYV